MCMNAVNMLCYYKFSSVFLNVYRGSGVRLDETLILFLNRRCAKTQFRNRGCTKTEYIQICINYYESHGGYLTHSSYTVDINFPSETGLAKFYTPKCSNRCVYEIKHV